MKMFAKWVLAAGMAVVLAAAQTPAQRKPAARKAAPKASPASKPAQETSLLRIVEIRVEGAQAYTPAQVIAASGLKVGDEATKENFERARDRILATGFIESFGWKYEGLPQGGVVATIQITEPASFLPWGLERIPAGRDEVSALLKRTFPMMVEDKLPPSESVIQRAAVAIQTMLGGKLGSDAVIGRVLLVGKDQITIMFGPKSAPPNVAEVRFTGSRIIDARYLVKSLSEVAIGTPYVEENFRLFLDNQIKPMYESVGRLRVAFPKVTVEPSKTMKGVVVTTEVVEGEPYKLEKIQVRGAPLSEGDIEEQGNFKTGEVVSYSDIGKGLNRILDMLKGGGYMKATYKAQRRLNDEKKTVEVFVDVDPGPQYKFGSLVIKGLDLESEPTIRKLWVMKPGDPFRNTYPDNFLARVRERGVFDNLGDTKAEVEADDKTLLVKVTLTFKGAPDPEAEKRKRQREPF